MSTLVTELKRQLAYCLASNDFALSSCAGLAQALRESHSSSDDKAVRLAEEIEWAFCDLERGGQLGSLRKRLSEIVTGVPLGQPPQIMEPTIVLDHGAPASMSWTKGATGSRLSSFGVTTSATAMRLAFC